MVKLHVKHGDESQFLLETTTSTPIDALINQVSLIYNGRLKVHRICNGILFKIFLTYLISCLFL